MASKSILLALSLSLLVSVAFGERPEPLRLTQEQQCRFRSIGKAKPSQTIKSEGGVTELWDESEDQFQCAGVVAMRNTLKPNALSLPNYHPAPRLVFIEGGEGYIGLIFPGCPETYHTHETEEKQRGKSERDLHQKVRRIRRGDIIAIPAGTAHWCYNDGNQELVAVSINDVNHVSNQLDRKLRAFYLAGGVPRSGQKQARETFHNIIQQFEPRLLAEAYNVPEELVRQMQEEEERGLIIIARERMSFIQPDEEQEQQRERRGERDNGIEESLCTMKISFNVEKTREADIYSRQAGKVDIVDRQKLPMLQYMDLSAEKGNLYPNAMLSLHWSMYGHTIVYVTRGDAQVQIVDQEDQALMNERVSKGDMFVVPQYYASMVLAGADGFEWVSFKTTGTPTSNTVAGYTSVIRAIPLQVLTNAYGMSPRQAQGLKINSGSQSLVLSPARGRQY